MNGVKAGIVREQERESNATGSLLTWQTTDQAVAPCPSQEKVVARTLQKGRGLLITLKNNTAEDNPPQQALS